MFTVLVYSRVKVYKYITFVKKLCELWNLNIYQLYVYIYTYTHTYTI